MCNGYLVYIKLSTDTMPTDMHHHLTFALFLPMKWWNSYVLFILLTFDYPQTISTWSILLVFHLFPNAICGCKKVYDGKKGFLYQKFAEKNLPMATWPVYVLLSTFHRLKFIFDDFAIFGWQKKWSRKMSKYHSSKSFISIDFGCTQVRSVLMMCVILQWTTADSVKWLIFNWKFNSPVTDYTSFKRRSTRIVQFKLEKKTSWSWNGMVEWTKWINAIWLWIKSIY